MKRLMMAFSMAALACAMAGCSKESRYESMTREAMSLTQNGKIDEEQIRKYMDDFRKMTAEEQDRAIKESEEAIKKIKELLKKREELKKSAGDLLKK